MQYISDKIPWTYISILSISKYIVVFKTFLLISNPTIDIVNLIILSDNTKKVIINNIIINILFLLLFFCNISLNLFFSIKGEFSSSSCNSFFFVFIFWRYSILLNVFKLSWFFVFVLSFNSIIISFSLLLSSFLFSSLIKLFSFSFESNFLVFFDFILFIE